MDYYEPFDYSLGDALLVSMLILIYNHINNIHT